jgi:hypothetical protein
MSGAVPALGDLTTSPAVTAGLVAEVGEPTPAPTQAPAGGFEAWEVSPGLIGFVPVFLIALACVGLFLSLTRQMRRVAVRQALRDAEEAAERRPGDDAHPADRARPTDGTRPTDGGRGPR